VNCTCVKEHLGEAFHAVIECVVGHLGELFIAVLECEDRREVTTCACDGAFWGGDLCYSVLDTHKMVIPLVWNGSLVEVGRF